MSKNNTKIIFFSSIITVLLSVGAFVFIFKIIANKNEHTSAVIATLNQKIINKENNSALANKITEIENTKKIIDSYFVDTNHIDTFIEYLEGLGSGFGVVTKVKNFEVLQNDKSILAVDLSSDGSFADVMRIIKLIENSPYQTRIKRVSLTKAPDTQTEVSLWQVNISFNILTSNK